MLLTTDWAQQTFILAANHPSDTPMYVHMSQTSLVCPADVSFTWPRVWAHRAPAAAARDW